MSRYAVGLVILLWTGSGFASSPSPHLGPRYLEPELRYHRLPYPLVFDGGCLKQRMPTQVLLAFEVRVDGSVASVRPLPPVPGNDALDDLLEAAREFHFSQKVVEWEAQPFSTVVAFPLPNTGCWRPPLGDERRRVYPQADGGAPPVGK